MLCTSCAAEIPEGARFCPSCGHSVAAPQNEERRIVTVLFADLVGFTALAEYLDPEQVKRFIDSCFQRLVDDVQAFGGRVDKLLGDGILALFGAPIAHEDDAERAVRAALRMQTTLEAHVSTSTVPGATEIRMRVGINTGEVLVGTLAGTDYTAMGDVVNTASRLQTAAPPGRVLVGGSTHRLTEGIISYEPAGELTAKGREQTVSAWLAGEAIVPPGARRQRRREVDLIGRESELAISKAALDLLSTGDRSVIVSIIGENGMGKSRLVDELLDHVRSGANASVLEGACVPYGEANVWWPIANALLSYLDIEPAQAITTIETMARERAAALAPHMDEASIERLIHVFTHVLGHPSPIDQMDPLGARAAVHHAVTKVLELRSSVRPTVLSIDDLHWADPVLIDLLAHLVNALARLPFALITTMRPGSDVVWPPPTERSTVVSLSLQPLSQCDSERLAGALLQDMSPDASLLTALYERSGGNPLFLQELAALTEATGGKGGDLPDSLRTLIGARLDQLTTEQRQVLDNASTLGTSGSMIALAKFAEKMGQTFNPDTVRELDDAGLLELRGARWSFRSDGVREAAYQTITKAARAQRHAGVAKSITDTAPYGIDDIAHHTAAAAELVRELGHVPGVPASIVDDAVIALTFAADRASDAGSLRTVVRTSTRALNLLDERPVNDERRSHLLLVRAEAYIDQRNYPAAHADIDALLAIAARNNDPATEAEARRLSGSLHHVESNMELARQELGRSVELLRELGLPDRLAEALRARGFIELFGGSLPDAEWFFGEADELYQSLGDPRGMAWIEQHRAWLSFLSNDMALARERLVSAAATLGELGDRNGVGWAFGLLAFVEFFERNFEAARTLAVQVGREAEDRGDEWAATMMQTLLADLAMWQGNLEEAARLADTARGRFKRLNDKFGLLQALAPLVRSQVALGRSAAAQRSIEELVSLADAGGHGPLPLMAAAGASMHRGDGNTAVALAQRASAEMRTLGGGAFEPTVLEALGWLQVGNVDDALILLESIDPARAMHPFPTSALALAYALAGEPAKAMSHAERVADTDGASYLDQVFAYIAAASAHAQLGHLSEAALTAEAAVAKAMGANDVVATALATRSYSKLTGTVHPADDDLTILGSGWLSLVERLVPVGVA